MDMSLGVACGLTSAVCWGLVDSCATIVSRRVGVLVTSTGMQAVALAPLVVLAIVFRQPIPTAGVYVAQAAFMGVVSALGYSLTYQAFRLGPVAVVSPVISAYGGLSVLLAVLLLGETPRPLQLWGVAAATIGIALCGVLLDRPWRRSRPVGRGVPFALGALVVWSVTVVGLASPVRELGWLPTLLISRFASTASLGLACLVTLARRWRTQARGRKSVSFAGDASGHEPAEPTRSPGIDRSVSSLIVTMGFLDVLGFAVWSVGLAASAAWLVGITGSLAPLVSMSFGLVILGERFRPNQWLGVGIVFASLLLISAP